jgi:AcrR family transcriptional regulator
VYRSVYTYCVDSRAGLLRAALTLFAAKGYDGVGVQEVAEAAGVAKPTLYHFFGSKHGLLEALFAEYATKLDDSVRAGADYQRNLPLTLDRIVAAYIDFAAQEPLFYRLELALYFSPRDSEAHQVAVRHYVYRQSVLEEVFRKAVREHGNMRGRHRRYAISLVGMINSYIALQLNERIVITDRLRRDIVHQFSHGIYS